MTEINHNPIPDWVDESLSRDLPVLRARGEGQEMEYMESFPANARDLAKEIAAFATSNAGTILIGVTNAGELVGLPSCATAQGRDEIIRRLEGITRGTVRPAITPTARFALENGVVVLVVSVPKGSQPVYYSSNMPYVRHLTEARPAEPHEVVERVAEYLQRSGEADAGSDERSKLYSDLARVLLEVLLFADQAEERQVNPWLDIWRSEYSYAASQLREVAATQAAIDERIDSELRELAGALDKVANLRLHLGSGDELSRATDAAAALARSMMERHVEQKPLGEGSLELIRNAVVKYSRKLQELASRAEETIESGRIEELQAEASALGHEIVRLSYYKIDALGEGIREELRNVGRLLHLTETMPLYMDGGISMQAVLDRVISCSDILSSLAGKLQG